MHVLFLNSWYPNQNAPTLGNFVKKHAEAAAQFEKVSCLAIFPSDSIDKIDVAVSVEKNLSEFVVYYPTVRTKIPLLKQILKLRAYKRAFQIGLKQIESKNGRIDITHLNVVFPLGIFARELKKTRGIPYVVTEHSTAYHQPDEKFTKTQRKMITRVLKDAVMILPVSNDLGQAIAKLCPNVPQKRVTNVVDPSTFTINNGDGHAFVHISTLDEAQKNPKGIIDVLAELKREDRPLKMKFISDFPFEQYLDYARSKGLDENTITFIGPLETSEIARELKEATALVLFSNYENFPCVIAEAFMCGIPVITTSVNGIPEFVNESNGIIFSPNDKSALKNAFISISDKKVTFDKNDLRDFALKEFSYESIGKQFSNIYKEVVKNVE